MFLDKIEKRSIDNYDWKTIASSGNYLTDNTKLKCSTYFNCLKIISEDIAKCNLHLRQETNKGEVNAKQHYLYEKLRLKPNDYMTSFDMFKTLTVLLKHEGKAGVYIDRDAKGKVKNLYPVNINRIIVDDVGLIQSKKENKVLVEFEINGVVDTCFYKDIIVLKDFTLNGVDSEPTKKYIKDNIDTSIKAQNYLNNLFDNGLTNKLVVQMTSDIQDSKELNAVTDKFNRLYSNNGRVFTIPAGFNVNPINLSLADAQFEQLKKMNVIEIATSFGIPLNKLNLVADFNNNSMEQTNVQYLVNTLLPIFSQIEQELDIKLLTELERKQGYKIRFNTNVMLRTDAKTQSEIISRYMDKGVYAINDARDILGLTYIENGDVPMVISGYMPLDIVKDYYSSKVEIKNKEGEKDE